MHIPYRSQNLTRLYGVGQCLLDCVPLCLGQIKICVKWLNAMENIYFVFHLLCVSVLGFVTDRLPVMRISDFSTSIGGALLLSLLCIGVPFVKIQIDKDIFDKKSCTLKKFQNWYKTMGENICKSYTVVPPYLVPRPPVNA